MMSEWSPDGPGDGVPYFSNALCVRLRPDLPGPAVLVGGPAVLVKKTFHPFDNSFIKLTGKRKSRPVHHGTGGFFKIAQEKNTLVTLLLLTEKEHRTKHIQSQ